MIVPREIWWAWITERVQLLRGDAPHAPDAYQARVLSTDGLLLLEQKPQASP